MFGFFFVKKYATEEWCSNVLVAAKSDPGGSQAMVAILSPETLNRSRVSESQGFCWL